MSSVRWKKSLVISHQSCFAVASELSVQRHQSDGRRKKQKKFIGTSLLCGQKSLVASSPIATSNN
ncbi:hypothetical protein IQ269_09465 [Tychonema sp. LEGE 07199]|uniref:hypothetical protein n=1 Tax=unclassified Tychonema TaxID=2642144 RepID=UPI001880D678|nr:MULTISPECIES: hypothetical protein [unclassified Tychonema]MBE9121040.1 hypothetical protein [Tychonema sp. LEGE 07199]MBE9133463.1 hypothetical protein [Tychonema sp. LEGE 07196]